jgi:hypothetical protein
MSFSKIVLALIVTIIVFFFVGFFLPLIPGLRSGDGGWMATLNGAGYLVLLVISVTTLYLLLKK